MMKRFLIFTVCFVATGFIGCSRGQSGNSSSSTASPPQTSKEPEQWVIYGAKKKDTSFYPVGTEKDFTHHQWSLAIVGDRSITIESLAWCEVANIPAEFVHADKSDPENPHRQYCVTHEVAKIIYNDKTSYINRKYNRYVPSAERLESNLRSGQPSSLWQADDTEWMQRTASRNSTPAKTFNVQAPLSEYRQYVNERHRLLTDRCRRMPNWKDMREQTPARQGNFTFYSKTMFALNTIEGNQMTAIELNPTNLDLKFVSTFTVSESDSFLNLFTDDYPNYETTIWELNVSSLVDKLISLQSLRPRDDHDVQVFGLTCDIGYKAFTGMDLPVKGCPFEWRDFVPLRTERIESQIEVAEFVKILKRIENDPIEYNERGYYPVRSDLMDKLPSSEKQALFPKACFDASPRSGFWLESDRLLKESKR